MSTYVAVFAMVLAYVALVGAYFALRTLAKVRRSTAVLARTTSADGTVRSLADATERQATETALLGEQVADLRAWVEQRWAEAESANSAAVAAAVAAVRPSDDEVGALRNIALVRYDAFSDMSGRMSFSLALLDRGSDGVVISAIAGRSDTRVYAKGVAGGRGEHELSPEEQQAVASAMNERRAGILQRKAG
ncbi:MAG: hypothetical protein QOE97_2545 [Pseudonocardiales bacterium]|nr:hypothetical protein [Pseudonocardiales bacterium]